MNELREIYKTVYRCMIEKDIETLSRLLDDSFGLIHMTGMRQSKSAYLTAIQDGTLNYFSADHDNITVEMNGDTAKLIGQSKVTAAVFGGGKHTWHLQQTIRFVRKNDHWLMMEAIASTY